MSRTLLSLLAVLAACTPGQTEPDPPVDQLPQAEIELRDLFASEGIALVGTVVDPSGAPIAGALVATGDQQATTDESGAFRIEGLPRHNGLVEVTAAAYRPHMVPAWLFRAMEVEEVALQPMVLTPEDPSTVRFLFGGDVAFGRRYLDTDESTPWDQLPPDDPEALIQVSDSEPGTREVLASLQPLFGAADYGVVNLESVVTLDPGTPHPTKDYVFFSMPGSVEALDWAGVDFISLGNNHVFDYLEPGVTDTLAWVDAIGLPHTGLGTDADEAWTPRHVDLGGTRYAMIAATSVDGFRHDIGYVATAEQGGAADLTDNEQLAATVAAEVDAGNVPIALWHTGIEYTYSPSEYSLSRMERAVDSGAALVIAHHPHVAQGFGRYQGKLLAHCLGNLAFDQQRLETMQGLMLQVDMAGDEVLDAQALPVVIEQYRPHLATGALSDGLLRRIAEFSDSLLVYPENDRAQVLAPGAALDRAVEVAVEVPDSGIAVLDLRDLAQLGESLHAASGPALARPGRDLLNHGTFEDQDVDDDDMEVAHWDVSGGSRFPCHVGARTGAVGVCSVRAVTNTSVSVTAFRNRIRVMGDGIDEPNKDLTVVGYAMGENAGPTDVIARYYASEGDAVFGQEVVFRHSGGTFDWTPFAFELSMPDDVEPGNREANPRALRLFLRQATPDSGEALAAWDDLAVVSWEETLDLAGGVTLPTPHQRDFLRVEASPGTISLQLTFRSYQRAWG
jgi:hypothetical protein